MWRGWSTYINPRRGSGEPAWTKAGTKTLPCGSCDWKPRSHTAALPHMYKCTHAHTHKCTRVRCDTWHCCTKLVVIEQPQMGLRWAQGGPSRMSWRSEKGGRPSTWVSARNILNRQPGCSSATHTSLCPIHAHTHKLCVSLLIWSTVNLGYRQKYYESSIWVF